MKKDIHPEYSECEISCACGSKVVTNGVMPSMHIEICAACHPFYTGKQRLVDTAGRIEKFNLKYKNSKAEPKAG